MKAFQLQELMLCCMYAVYHECLFQMASALCEGIYTCNQFVVVVRWSEKLPLWFYYAISKIYTKWWTSLPGSDVCGYFQWLTIATTCTAVLTVTNLLWLWDHLWFYYAISKTILDSERHYQVVMFVAIFSDRQLPQPAQCNHCLFSLSATRVANHALSSQNNQFVFAVWL